MTLPRAQDMSKKKPPVTRGLCEFAFVPQLLDRNPDCVTAHFLTRSTIHHGAERHVAGLKVLGDTPVALVGHGARGAERHAIYDKRDITQLVIHCLSFELHRCVAHQGCAGLGRSDPNFLFTGWVHGCKRIHRGDSIQLQ